MRTAILLPLALLAAPAFAQAPAVPPPQTLAEQAVPQDHGEQVVLVQARTFPPGTSSGWHVHPGVEIGTVVSGETVMRTAAGVRTYKAGESFTIPRGVAHDGGNAGHEPTRLLITLLVDKGAPPRQSVPAP